MIARWTAGLLLLAIGCGGGEPERTEVAALLRASSALRLGQRTSQPELQAWAARLGLPGCDVGITEYDEIGVGYGGCSVDRVVLDGGEHRFSFLVRLEEWREPEELYLTGFRLAQDGMELMGADGRRPDGLVPRAARQVWGAATATCGDASVWVLPDRTAYLTAASDHDEPELMVQAPPRIDGRAVDCLAAAGQSPTRTKGAQ